MVVGSQQRGLAGRVHVADDHVRAQPRLKQRLGAAVDRDEHGAHVADERAQRAQVVLMLDAAHDHQRGAVAEVGGEARQVDPPGEQFALLAHVLDRVAREPLQRLSHLAPAGLGLRAHARQIQHDSLGQEPIAAQHLGVADGDRLAIGEAIKQRVIGQVNEVGAGLHQQLRAEVRVGAAAGGPAVEYGGCAGGDQLLRRDPVDVEMVDHGYVSAGEVPDQQLGAPAQPRGTRDRAPRRDIGRLERGFGQAREQGQSPATPAKHCSAAAL